MLLIVFTLLETICRKICSKSRLKGAKRQLPVDVRRSKTLLLKLPNLFQYVNCWQQILLEFNSQTVNRSSEKEKESREIRHFYVVSCSDGKKIIIIIMVY